MLKINIEIQSRSFIVFLNMLQSTGAPKICHSRHSSGWSTITNYFLFCFKNQYFTKEFPFFLVNLGSGGGGGGGGGGG